MAENTKIEWAKHTFNPWIGCTKVHTGCINCYAESLSKRTGKAKWGPQGTRVKTSEDNWRKPVKWNREAQCNCGAAGRGDRECAFCAGGSQRPRVFCASLADVFEDWQGPILNHHGEQLWQCCNCDFIAPYDPLKTLRKQGLDNACECSGNPDFVPLGMNALRKELFKLIDTTPNLDWLLLTKRPENVMAKWPLEAPPGTTLYGFKKRRNVWLGTSISDQETADSFVPRLLECHDLCSATFLSAEPLLGPIDLAAAVMQRRIGDPDPDQVIVGCESSGKRVGRLGEFKSEADWWQAAESIASQCVNAGVAYFGKQGPVGGLVSHEPSEWPYEVCRLRQFPATEPAHAP